MYVHVFSFLFFYSRSDCDFFERRGEKRIEVGTLLTFRKFFFSDGVLCFWSILCVILLSVEVKNV